MNQVGRTERPVTVIQVHRSINVFAGSPLDAMRDETTSCSEDLSMFCGQVGG
jgi:hypothetical protein